MKTKAAKIYLKTPERKWLWRGGLAACVLPLFGCLAFMLIGFLNKSDPNTMGAIYITPSEMTIFMVIPIAGTIIAAYLGTREIIKKNNDGFSGKSSFIWVALKAGFFAHWIIVSLLFIFLILVGGSNIFGPGIDIFLKIIMLAVFYAFLFWGFLTLPISLIGGFLFWFVAVRGSENLMAKTFD